jgi:hypothetical protein
MMGKDQQQLAGTVCFTFWHLMQTSWVSLQLSEQRGMKQSPYAPTVKRRHMHQAHATHPSFFLGMLPVSWPQIPQGDPLELLFCKLMIIGPC